MCELRKMRITELAKKCGLSPQSIHDAINRNSTKTEHLEKIATALEVPVSHFFDDGQPSVISKGSKSCQGCKDKEKIVHLLEANVRLLEDKIHYLEDMIDRKQEKRKVS